MEKEVRIVIDGTGEKGEVESKFFKRKDGVRGDASMRTNEDIVFSEQRDEVVEDASTRKESGSKVLLVSPALEQKEKEAVPHRQETRTYISQIFMTMKSVSKKGRARGSVETLLIADNFLISVGFRIEHQSANKFV